MNEHRIDIPPRLWDLLQTMASDMAVSPQVLVNQAVFNWARVNGYVATRTFELDSDAAGANAEPEAEAETEAKAEEFPVPVDIEALRAAQAERIQAISRDVARLTRPVGAEPAEAGSGPDPEPEPDSASAPAATGDDATWVDKTPEDPESVVKVLESGEYPEDEARASRPALILTVEGEDPILVAQTPFFIGRNEDCDLRLGSDRVSRKHAVIENEGRTKYRIVDRDSTNGVWYGKERVARHVLRDGDILQIGDTRLRARLRLVSR